MWYRFSDAYSGGYPKQEQYRKVYIEATDEDDAVRVFTAVTGLNPYNVTCTCCGEDYSVIDAETLRESTDYDRVTLGLAQDEYIARPDVLVVFDGRHKDDA